MSVSTAIRNPRGFVVGKWQALKRLLFDPGAFYESKPSSGRVWSELLVALLVALPGSLGAYFAARTVMQHFSTSTIGGGQNPIIGEQVAFQVWGQTGQAVIGIFVLWIGFAIALYGLSWLYSNRGGFFGVFKATAWALVPLFFANLIRAIGIVIAAWNEEVTATAGELIGPSNQVAMFLLNQILEEPPVLVGTAISLVFVVWVGYIAAHAVASVRDIPVSNAYRVAAVPTVVYGGWIVRDVLQLAGVL